MIFTISARSKPKGVPVLDFLQTSYPQINLADIDSVFGFVEKSTLYGGRQYDEPELNDDDVLQLNKNKIGLRIPFTNHLASKEEFIENKAFLDKYHKKGNAVIVTNDDLAKWIRKDFPKYRIEASVIKNINTHAKISEAMQIYDTVVLPMILNQDLDFLKKAKNKKRITLFANAGCALNCPSKICYPSISKYNKFQGGEFKCSQTIKYRKLNGMIDFNLEELVAIGFSRFKLFRARGKTGY